MTSHVGVVWDTAIKTKQCVTDFLCFLLNECPPHHTIVRRNLWVSSPPCKKAVTLFNLGKENQNQVPRLVFFPRERKPIRKSKFRGGQCFSEWCFGNGFLRPLPSLESDLVSGSESPIFPETP